MKDRLHYLLTLSLVFLLFLPYTQAQFTPPPPDTLIVDSSCNAPFTVSAMPTFNTDSTAYTFTFSETLSGYDNGDPVYAGTIVNVTYIVDYLFTSDTFDFPLVVIDTIAPVFDFIPNDTLLNCFETVPSPYPVTVSDDCDNDIDIVFEETAVPNCATDYSLLRKWTASDDSGNTTEATQLLTITDNEKPEYTALPDTTIDCAFNDIAFTGNIEASDVTDCSSSVNISFNDVVTNGSCNYESVIERTWTVSDNCGNDSISVQIITVVDTIAPTFTAVTGDTIVSCTIGLNIDNLGMPIDVQDNCDTNPTVSKTDFALGNICTNSYFFERRWYVSDVCGNTDSLVMQITVADTVAPVITTNAQDENFSCASSFEINAAFITWINNRGGAAAEDFCTPDADLIWNAYNSGTSDFANLPAAVCPANNGDIYRSQTVDFVVQDACGNADTTTAVFTVLDTSAPELTACPVDTTLAAGANCLAEYSLTPPIIAEGCGSSIGSEQHNATLLIFGQPGPPNDTPVQPVNINFGVSASPAFATDSAIVTINLFNVDSEDPTEYFNVVDENGVIVGQTVNSNSQCGNSTTILKFAPDLVSNWAFDGVISFTLEPNIPVGLPGRFSVNPICQGISYTTVNLFYLTNLPNQLTYEYSINEGARINPGSVTAINESFGIGDNEVTYYATDCVGNQDSCTFVVTVEDNTPPSADCPADMTFTPNPGECGINFTLPFPENISDNCGVGNIINLQGISTTGDSLITFSDDPNLGDFIAENKIFNITGTGANVISSVNVTVRLQADDSGTGAYFTILDEDNNALGTINSTGCSQVNEASFTLSSEDYNTWAADGMVTFTAVSNTNIPIPPGGPGDGINPCDASAVQNNGDNDDSSFMTLAVSYQELSPTYYTEGATQIAATQMQGPDYMPEEMLNSGVTEIFYVIEDINGNADTCSYTITVEDTEAPTVLCGPSFVSINPSGTVTDTIYPAEIDLGSFDNCAIDTMFVTPNIVTCNSDTLNVTLTVIDEAGNQETCETFVGVTPEGPAPTYTVDCVSNSLQLFSNAPTGLGGLLYTYEWTGPNNFLSFAVNPEIQDTDGSRAGFYTVEITGVTGCTAEGVIEVLQSDLPPVTPDFFIVDENVCSNESIVLTASSQPGSGQVDYTWYEETPTGNVELAVTNSPFYSFPAPTDAGTYCYYVIASRNNCFSQVSITRCVQVSESPTAMFEIDNITVCEGEDVILEAVLPLPGPGISYQFIGPSGSQDSPDYQFTIDDPVANDGDTYLLTAFNNGCQSNTVTATVFVNEVPEQPEITSNSPVCFGDTLKLLTNITGVSNYIWTGPNFIEFFTNEPSLQIPNADEDYDGNWRVRVVTEENCSSTNSAFENVIISPAPVVAASVAENPNCDNEDIELIANEISDAVYQWSGPNNFSAGVRLATAAPIAGTYSVTVTDQNNCSGTDSLEVNLLESPEITGTAASDDDCPTGPQDVILKALLSEDSQDYDFEWTGTDFVSTDSCAIIEAATPLNNGNYQIVVTAANGCTDTSSVQVTMGEIINTPSAPVSSTGNSLCAGEVLSLTGSGDFPSTNVTWYWITPTGTIPTSTSSLIIDPVMPANTGEYRVYTQVDECFSDTSGVLLLTVNPAPVTNAECLNCPVCEGDDIQLSADCDIIGAEYEWSGITGSSLCNPIIPNASLDSDGATATVRVRVGECWSQPSTIFISVNERPNNPQATQNGPYCVGTESITLNVTTSTATPGAVYRWYRIEENGSGTEVGMTLSTTFNVPDSDTYTDGNYSFFVIAELNGCTSLPSPDIIVSVSTIPDNQANAGTDLLVCEEDVIVLEAENPTVGTGLWTQLLGNAAGAEISNPDASTTTVTGLVPGSNGNTYNFVWSLSNGACVNYSIDTSSIAVNLVELAEAGDFINICSVSETNLAAVAPSFGIGTWTQPTGQEQLGVVIDDINAPNSLVTGLVPGNTYIFTWNIPDNGCGGDSDDVLVQVSNDVAFAGQDFEECGNGCTILDATNPNIGSGQWFSPNGNISFATPNDPNSEVCGLQAGDNFLIWILNEGNCGPMGIDTVVVNYKFAPVAEEDLYSVPFAGTVDFNVLENDSPNGNFFINIVEAPQHGRLTESTQGVFTYTADINYIGSDFATYELCAPNCECSEAVIRIAIGGSAPCEVPTIITPNDDGLNDAFVIPCLAQADKYPGNSVSIFNQWGDEVFKESPYSNEWQGTYNGQELPAGTYFFIVDFGQGDKPQTGFLIINR